MATKLQVSNFEYVQMGKKITLRFTFALQIECEDGSPLELCIDGCYAYYRKIDNTIVWSMPLTRHYNGRTVRQPHWINPRLYNVVMDALKERPKLLDKLRPDVDKIIQRFGTDKVDSEIPEIFERKL